MRKAAGFWLAILFMAVPGVALAAGGVENTLGGRLAAIGTELWKPLFVLVSFGSFIGGLILLGVGLMKLTRQGESRGGLWDSGLAHLVAAALLISLPSAAGMGVTTLFGNTGSAGTLGSEKLDTGAGAGQAAGVNLDGMVSPLRGAVGTQDCLAQAAPAACMAGNLAVNAVPMAVWTLFAFAFILGLIGLASAIVDLTKGQQQGGMPKGLGTKFATSILLLNGMTLYTFTTNTLLGNKDGASATILQSGLNDNSGMLRYTVSAGPEILKKYAELIGHCFTILAFFGAWAFIKGIFMIRAASEGRSQGTVGMGMVYIVAGILLANAKYSTCMILTTLGGQSMGGAFCTIAN